jgi:hypothetical protein
MIIGLINKYMNIHYSENKFEIAKDTSLTSFSKRIQAIKILKFLYLIFICSLIIFVNSLSASLYFCPGYFLT